MLLQPDNPLAPLGRRWLRAAQLLADGLPPSPDYDDDWGGHALRFQSPLRGCGNEADRLRLAQAMPAVHQAHTLREADPPLVR